MNQSWYAFQQTLTKELGETLAEEFVRSLFAKSGGCEKKAAQFFYELGRTWAPLMQAWSKWIEKNAESTIAMILRDAKPLSALPTTKKWKRLYLNRLTCGVPDELSGDASTKQHPLLKRYLSQHGCAKHFTFVDSGCYGTVVLELHKLGLNFRPLFFFSKNPNIPGFLNEIGVSMEDGEILNDSLECGFPHMHARPSELIEKNGRVIVSLCASDRLSVLFGNAAMRGVHDASLLPSIHANEAARSLLDLSHRARLGEFTGVLGHTSPEWSKKTEFLASWPKELCWK